MNIEKSYSIAGKIIKINSEVEYKESENFKQFLCNSVDYDVEIYLKNTKNIIQFNYKPVLDKYMMKVYKENNKFFREMVDIRNDKPHSCFIENSNSKKYTCYLYPDMNKDKIDTRHIFQMIGIESLLYKLDTFILHSSYIKYKDKAILFSGPSGIGKSTQAKLWEEYEYAEIVNGDKVGINNDGSEWCAHGLPYAGSSNIYKNITLPISSIIILRQSPINKIKKLSQPEAFKLIYSETILNNWNEDYIKEVSNLVSNLVQKIPVYILSCKPDYTAVQLLKSKLGE